MTKIIVAVDESDGSRDAITLASALARMTGAILALVNVFPYVFRRLYEPENRPASAASRRDVAASYGSTVDASGIASSAATRRSEPARRRSRRGGGMASISLA